MKIAITEAHRKEIKSLRDQLAAVLKNQKSSSAEYSRLTQKSEQLTEKIATLEKGDTESDGVASALATKRVQLEEVAKKISKLSEATVAIDPFANDRIMNLLRELTHYAAQACLPAIKDYVGVIADKIRPWCLDDANAMVWEDAAQFPLKGDSGEEDFSPEGLLDSESRARIKSYNIFEREIPVSYTAEKFSVACWSAAKSHLENCLREICLDPAESLKYGPWYFPGLITTLREYQADYIKTNSAGEFTTELGRKVSEVLDYTAYCRGLTLIQGEARLGKSHAAKAWCSQHPGKARFLEVPDGADDASFFRDMARGLGLGNFLNYKVVQIRERVESVLLAGDLVLVLDEAHRLWPQTHFRAGYPKRMVWVMTMANAGVPICMISTNQFFATQKVVEKNGWNSAQLTGRISHYECLPSELSPEDLIGVAKAVLPEADAKTLRALAVYARSSSRYLAAIDSITKRARYVAQRSGRDVATTDDVRTAMQESVIPADTKLHRALESVGKGKLARITPAPALSPDSDAQDTATETEPAEFPAARSRVPVLMPGSRIRAGNEAPLIEA